MSANPLLIILGPTASGKTRLAVAAAAEMNGEVISADSRQVFKGMDIGTGKDLQEYRLAGQQIPFHLINIREAGEQYNVNAFKNDFYDAYSNILQRSKFPVLCGGTGMYIHSLLQNHQYTAIPGNEELRNQLPLQDLALLRKELAAYPAEFTAHADLSSAKRIVRAIEIAHYLQNNTFNDDIRPVLHPLVIGINAEVEQRRERIFIRLEKRFKEGLIDEVKSLLQSGVSADTLIFYGMEYKYVTLYLQNELNMEELKEKLYIAIRQFSKRQMTFFRKMEKDGVHINWLAASPDTPAQLNLLRQLCVKKYSL